MSFAKAFEKVGIKQSTPVRNKPIEDINPEEVPMMYRAQVGDRCSLMFAGNNANLARWCKEWVDPRSENDPQPRYQRQEPYLGLDGSIYRIMINFPFRLTSNCGQDSILRPVMGKGGIPFIPGSGIKGVFRRACTPEQASRYCGNKKELRPGILRFHGAYPIGNWANRITDVIHPQQSHQVKGEGSSTAFAMISLYKPTMIFEMSSAEELPPEEWEKIGGLLKKALRCGVGGKTSTGYGLPYIPKDRYPIQVELLGYGVSSLLRTDEPEFRPNVFKASLRGHVMRLLGGACNSNKRVEEEVNRLFGYTKPEEAVEIYWQTLELKEDNYGRENTPIFKVSGNLHIYAPQEEDIEFLKSILKFAFVMGGFGKSWRRVWHTCSTNNWHQGFFQSYNTRAIGCHWQWEYDNFDSSLILDNQALKIFLNNLHSACIKKMSSNNSQFLNWREAFHPKRVSIYCKPVDESEVVKLFHKDPNHPFRTTPAISGKKLVKINKTKNVQEVEEEKLKFFVSSVWHRMLPIGNNQYLEIVTVFHGDRSAWLNNTEDDQLVPFIQALESRDLKLTWGENPIASG